MYLKSHFYHIDPMKIKTTLFKEAIIKFMILHSDNCLFDYPSISKKANDQNDGEWKLFYAILLHVYIVKPSHRKIPA